ncbi:hypothetical protein [Hydrogeniiclostridium mannosilyticum]|uniref:hypothetical protein n=1 Tax=Hydrogeniiclostridium mannosilyticum TaxID=2764322 RepID=UPI00399C0EE1
MEFSTVCFGYNKKEVTQYIQTLLIEIQTLKEHAKNQSRQLQRCEMENLDLRNELLVQKEIMKALRPEHNQTL